MFVRKMKFSFAAVFAGLIKQIHYQEYMEIYIRHKGLF